MLLKLTHTTDLHYSGLISESIMELRMAPRQEEDQHRLAFTLAIGPPTSAFSYFDWLGNTVHWFTVNSFHKDIRIIATSVVETDRPPIDPQRLRIAGRLRRQSTITKSMTTSNSAARSSIRRRFGNWSAKFSLPQACLWAR